MSGSSNKKNIGWCKSTPNQSEFPYKCSDKMGGKTCEELNGNECQVMMTEHGCCYHSPDDPDKGQGNAPIPTNDKEDWFVCGNDARYLKYMPKDNTELCHCTGENTVICGYDPVENNCGYFSKSVNPPVNKDKSKPWKREYTCEIDKRKIVLSVSISLLLLLVGGLIYKGRIDQLVSLLMLVMLGYSGWFVYVNLLNPTCPKGSKNTGLKSCLQSTKSNINTSGSKCPDGYSKHGEALGLYTCAENCLPGFTRRSLAAGTAFCDKKLTYIYNPLDLI